MAFEDVFGGSSIYPSDVNYISLILVADVRLNWPIEQQVGGPLIVGDIMDIQSGTPGLSVIIPDARIAAQGFTALFNNIGSETIAIRTITGGIIATIAPGSIWQIYLTDNSTADGSWRTFQFGASVSVINAAALAGAGLINIGVALALNIDVTTINSSPYVMDAASRARLFNWIGGIGIVTLPDPSVVGDGWLAFLRNSGLGDVTITPTVGLIDGQPFKTLSPGGSIVIVSDGLGFLTVSGTGSGGGGGGGDFNLLSIDVSGGGDYILNGAQLGQIGYKFTGVLTANRNIIVPNAIAEYWVDNQTTGAFSLTVKTAAGTGNTVAQGNRAILYCDGVNVVSADSQVSISIPVPITQGGTGGTDTTSARAYLGVPPIIRDIATGIGLAGGGDLSADRVLTLAFLGLELLTDPNADRVLFWDDSAGAFKWLQMGTNLAITGDVLDVSFPPPVYPLPWQINEGGTGQVTAPAALAALGGVPLARQVATGVGLTGGGDLNADRSLSLSFLGLQTLVDPNVDRVLFWDESAGTFQWLEIGSGLEINGTVLSAPNAQRVEAGGGSLAGIRVGQSVMVLRPIDRIKSATALSADEYLVMPNLPIGRYAFDGHITIQEQGAGVSGFAFSFVAAAAAMNWLALYGTPPAGAGRLDGIIGQYSALAGPASTASRYSLHYSAGINVTAPTTISFDWAQSALAAPGTTLLAGSWFRITRLS